MKKLLALVFIVFSAHSFASGYAYLPTLKTCMNAETVKAIPQNVQNSAPLLRLWLQNSGLDTTTGYNQIQAVFVLQKKNAECANLENISFAGSPLRSVNFKGANLVNVDFTNSDISGSDFTGAKVRGAVFENTSGMNSALQRYLLENGAVIR